MTEYRTISALPKPTRASINRPLDHEGNTYLHLLCKLGANTGMINDAIRLGANVDALNDQKMPPMALAILQGSTENVDELIRAKASFYMTAGNDKHFNALYMAVSGGSDAMISFLIGKGAAFYVNKPGMDQYGRDEGWFCLHRAINKDRYSLIQQLVNAGAFVDAEAGPAGLSSLQLSAGRNSVLSTENLLKAGADIDLRNSKSGMTAVHYAAFHNELNTLECLLAHGADPNIESFAGATPLSTACSHGSFHLANVLISYKANVNHRENNSSKETPLIKTAKLYNSWDLIDILLKANADPLLTDAFNRKASSFALQTSVRDRLLAAEKEAERRHVSQTYQKRRQRKPKNNTPNNDDKKAA